MTVDDLPQIGAPALRALEHVGINQLRDVVAFSEDELLALHGFGPKALRILREALHEAGLELRS